VHVEGKVKVVCKTCKRPAFCDRSPLGKYATRTRLGLQVPGSLLHLEPMLRFAHTHQQRHYQISIAVAVILNGEAEGGYNAYAAMEEAEDRGPLDSMLQSVVSAVS
jgi:hypothetical protein